MHKVIEIYRHQESKKKQDPILGKVPTLKGIARSAVAGYQASQQYLGKIIKGFHSSAARTEQALDAYLIGAGFRSKEHLTILDHVGGPAEVKQRRKYLGDDEAMRINLTEYDKDLEGTLSDYYQALRSAGESIAHWAIEQTGEGSEIIVAYTHEPILSISLIELAKICLDYDGSDNVGYFMVLTGNNIPRFIEGTGYQIEVVESEVSLITNAGRHPLVIPGRELEEIICITQ